MIRKAMEGPGMEQKGAQTSDRRGPLALEPETALGDASANQGWIFHQGVFGTEPGPVGTEDFPPERDGGRR